MTYTPQLHTRHNKNKGNMGEDIACKFLIGKGFKVIARNFQKPWGELDIVAEKDAVTHFIEVKSVTISHRNIFSQSNNTHQPEDNVDGFKVKQICRMIQTYLRDTDRGQDVEFTFHIICVYMNMETRKAKVKWIKNIIL